MERNYNTFAKRLDFMLRDSNVSRVELAEMLDVHRTTVYWWLSGKNTPKGERMRKVEQIFSAFNPTWINHGRGDIYKDASTPSISRIEQLEKIIQDKDKMIKLLEEKIETLSK